MKRWSVFSLVLVFPLVALSLTPDQKSRRHVNKPPSIKSFTSSPRTLEVCPVRLDKPEVFLFVEATDPDDDTLHYQYSTNEGVISGEGTSVLWSLDGVPRGPHEVHVTVTDEKGGKATAALTVTTIDSGICDPGPPPCPTIKVSCAEEVDHSQPFIFSVRVEVDPKDRTSPTFTWKINAGRIVSGQKSSQIEVTTRGADGFENITATVAVGGFDPSCTGTIAQCSTKIVWRLNSP
jgi:hypothetical protein